MSNRLVLIVGSGRCGLLSLVNVLNRQPHTRVSLEDPPRLPWKHADSGRVIRARLARLRRALGPGVVGDAASFYLPYLEDALAAEPELRVLGLKRPRAEVVASFGRFLDEYNSYPTDHWADEPALGWYHDPLWAPSFPQYDLTGRDEGIRRYWDDYYRTLEDLAARHPGRVRVFDIADTSIRLWHVGHYGYSWEDSGRQPERTASFTLHLPGQPPAPGTEAAAADGPQGTPVPDQQPAS